MKGGAPASAKKTWRISAASWKPIRTSAPRFLPTFLPGFSDPCETNSAKSRRNTKNRRCRLEYFHVPALVCTRVDQGDDVPFDRAGAMGRVHATVRQSRG